MSDVTSYFKAPKSKRSKSLTPEQVEVRRLVAERSKGRDEVDSAWPADVFHHRKRAGRIDTVENLLHIDQLFTHNRIHHNPDWSYRHGLLVREWQDPALVPVFAGCSVECERDHVAEAEA